jgi:hypothetical protein
MSTTAPGLRQSEAGQATAANPEYGPHGSARTLRAPSLIAGVGLLVMAALSAFGIFGPLDSLVTPGDAPDTAADVSGSEMLFRLGTASLIAVAVLDIVVAGALLEVFVSVNRGVSAMAAGFRVAYAGIFLVAISHLLEVPQHLDDGTRILQAVDAFGTLWKAGLILFAVHLLLIGYLAVRSGFMAKIFGVLLLAAGGGYLIDGMGAVLVPAYSVSVAQFAFVGEVALIFWLLIKGRRTVPGQPPKDPVTVDAPARRV